MQHISNINIYDNVSGKVVSIKKDSRIIMLVNVYIAYLLHYVYVCASNIINADTIN